MNTKKIKGIVGDIYEDFDTLEYIIKNRAVAFRLDTCNNVNEGNKEKVIVVYDKNAVKLGLIKIGESLTCFGDYSGVISAIDSKRNVVEDKMFLCIGIMGDADVDEEELARQGAVRLR
jgi:hypothetical protein